MAQQDLNTINHAPGNLPEASEYILGLVLPALNLLEDKKVDRSTFASNFSDLVDLLGSKADKSDLISFQDMLASKVNKYDLVSFQDMLTSKVNRDEVQQLMESVSSIYATRQEMMVLANSFAQKVTVDEFRDTMSVLTLSLERKVDTVELSQLANDLEARIATRLEELTVINVFETKVATLKAVIIAMAAKIDATATPGVSLQAAVTAALASV